MSGSPSTRLTLSSRLLCGPTTCAGLLWPLRQVRALPSRDVAQSFRCCFCCAHLASLHPLSFSSFPSFPTPDQHRACLQEIIPVQRTSRVAAAGAGRRPDAARRQGAAALPPPRTEGAHRRSSASATSRTSAAASEDGDAQFRAAQRSSTLKRRSPAAEASARPQSTPQRSSSQSGSVAQQLFGTERRAFAPRGSASKRVKVIDNVMEAVTAALMKEGNMSQAFLRLSRLYARGTPGRTLAFQSGCFFGGHGLSFVSPL